jgi:hypothetical protein
VSCRDRDEDALALGSWGFDLGESDVFADVYGLFYEHYNSGASPGEASESVRSSLAELFDDQDDRYDAHYALALAQWETRSLERTLLKRVESFVLSGADVKNWIDRGADQKAIDGRTKAIAAFLDRLRKAPVQRKRRSTKKVSYEIVRLIDLPSPDGLKTLSVFKKYFDGNYLQTGATIRWDDGGGSIFYFSDDTASVSARWLDSSNLSVDIESQAKFLKKASSTYFCGDKVYVHYEEK